MCLAGHPCRTRSFSATMVCMRLTSLLLLTLLLVSACRRNQDNDGGGGLGAGDSTTGSGSGNGGGGAGGAAAPSAEPLASAVVEATAAAIAMAGPLYIGGDQLHQEQDSADEDRAQNLVEDAVATNSIVTDGTCVAFDWMGLTCEITFTECTLEATGLPLDGGLTFTVTITPTAFVLDLDQLTLGPSTADGSVAVNFTGDGMLGRTTSADLTLSTGAAMTHFTLEGGRLNVDPGMISARGSGTITTGALDAAYDADAVTWVQGDKCPSSGTIELAQEGLPTMTVTFLPTTPDDGAVEVTVGNFPSVSEVLTFCVP